MLFADHQEFYKCFTEKDILHPVALLSDGHSSRFDYEVQSFLEWKHICFFFTMPDTTGITQLLNWLNKNLHGKDKEIRIASLYLYRLLTRRLSWLAELQKCWNEMCLTASTPNTSMDAQSPVKRKNFAANWKAKFDGPQQFVRQLSEKSLQLEEILGALNSTGSLNRTIQKINSCCPSSWLDHWKKCFADYSVSQR